MTTTPRHKVFLAGEELPTSHGEIRQITERKIFIVDAQGDLPLEAEDGNNGDFAIVTGDGTLWYRTGGSWTEISTGGITDHGALTGLADDDHTAYATNAELTSHEGAADPHTVYVKENDANWTDLTDLGATTLHSHAAAGGVNVQEFTVDGTWTKPAGAVLVDILVVGGGGSGAGGGSGTSDSGGGGGAGGGAAYRRMLASELAATEAVTVGVGGATVAGQSGNSTGAGGNNGESSSFGSHITAHGGVGPTNGGSSTGGPGGSNTALSTGETFDADEYWLGGNGGSGDDAGGQSSGASITHDDGTASFYYTRFYGATGGGGAGGTNAGAGFFPGADGGRRLGKAGGVGGATDGANGASGTAATGRPGIGGGGGAGSVLTNGGDGAAGVRGGGGGGGGACGSGFTSGDGGAGGDGYVRVITYLG